MAQMFMRRSEHRTISEFYGCTEKIATILDEFFGEEVSDMTAINECVEYYQERHRKKDESVFHANWDDINGGSK